MRRFIYAPKAYVYIKADPKPSNPDGLYNLSDLVVSGNVSRKINGVSTAEVTFQNPYRQFTDPGNPAFRPMDRITIWLQRVPGLPVQTFTGYLDEAPYYQMYPGVCTVRASCTLKRLEYTYFDPGVPFTMAFLAKYGWLSDGTGGIFKVTDQYNTPSAGSDAPALTSAGSIPRSARVKVKGAQASPHQIANMNTVLDVAKELSAPPRATKAMIVAAIGESSFDDNAANGSHVGVFQSNQIPASQTATQAHHFLTGGRSFRAGGAIQAAKDNPGWSVGKIASYTEVSDADGSFYDNYADEADAIIAAYSGHGVKASAASTGSTGSVTPSTSTPARAAYTAAVALDQENRNYEYGGGHGSWTAAKNHNQALDCSSSVSLVLKNAGMMGGVAGPQASPYFASTWGKPGKGEEMTVWAKDSHVFIEFNIDGKRGTRLDTSPWGSGGSGPHVRFTDRPTDGFTPRHWSGDLAASDLEASGAADGADAGSSSVELVNANADVGQSSSIADLMFACLKHIGNWDDKHIYIDVLPEKLIEEIGEIYMALAQEQRDANDLFTEFIKEFVGASESGGGGTASPNDSTTPGDIPDADGYTETTWSATFLLALGMEPTPKRMQAMVGWVRLEGGHWNNDARYNPLNTTMNMPGSGDTGTQGNISVFTSWKQGLEATVKTITLKQYGYPAVLAAFRNGSIDDIARALSVSAWCLGGYTGLRQAMAGVPSDIRVNVDSLPGHDKSKQQHEQQ
jgi:hypothetical protein